MYFVYIIKSLTDGNFCYKGLARDLEKRILEHNSGRVISTKLFKPFKLIHVEVCDTRDEARKLEKFFKSGYGREVIEEIIDSK